MRALAAMAKGQFATISGYAHIFVSSISAMSQPTCGLL
jgi:uncharacterized protein (DUF2252 family)